MATGISLHIGVNEVDTSCYGGWEGKLSACENDATDMYTIAAAQGFEATLLHSAAATATAVIDHIERAAATLGDDDIFLLSYAGHGGQVRDVNGDETEDGRDETWCLYERQLIDDELNYLWSKFKPGVRILLFSDSCHSGTVHRGDESREENLANYATAEPVFRNAPDAAIKAAYRALAETYKKIQLDLASKEFSTLATVRLLSGCQDDQRSVERGPNGLFTTMVKKVWDNGSFTGDYDEFHRRILEQMPTKQTPQHKLEGPPAPWASHTRAFSITS